MILTPDGHHDDERCTGEDCPVCDHDCPGAGCPVCDHASEPAYPHGYPCDPADAVEQGTACVGRCATCQQQTVVARIADVHGDLCETCATAEEQDLLDHPEAMPGVDPFSFAILAAACRSYRQSQKE